MSFLVDTHCHLYLPDFDADRDAMIQRAQQAGIKWFVLPNIDRNSLAPLTDLCRKYPQECFPLLGLHPCSVSSSWNEELQIIKDQFCRTDLAWVGIGETGLDFYWNLQYVQEQKLNFKQHIFWAIEYDLPLIIHSRNAIDDCIQMISQHKHPRLRGIFHCFSGTLEQAQSIVALGFCLGIGGVVTFPKSGLDQVLLQVGLEHMVLETDSPYLAPIPYRGKRNESSYLKYIAEKVAEIFKTDTEHVARQTTGNAARLFGFRF
ncbi:MAG: TatD family hydrolase [Chitinophagales bacterium]|nr:TatD family hydrolase [Chitinophagales bacterium]MDW8426999.1 TatD family hydrolase [Chitinophagales bacterium]